IARILGIDRVWKIALVGVGNVGSALVSYKEFARQGFKIVKLFDNDQRKIGSNHKGIVVSDVKNIVSELSGSEIEMVVVCVPGSVAQFVVDDIVKAGLRAILNFAPVNLKVPDNVFVRNENMAMELEYLSYALVNNHSKNRVK
ncbi:MAG: redox-sensing transcriptional repressor Rex, partial [candidate division Zixibacteria bacterium]|nr:redox-sensing transcriptional repressor Rex [candidate division Zixibacteria bacterium]